MGETNDLPDPPPPRQSRLRRSVSGTSRHPPPLPRQTSYVPGPRVVAGESTIHVIINHRSSPDQLHCRATSTYQQTQDVESMLVWRWSSVVDGGPTLNQSWFKVLCLLGSWWTHHESLQSIYLTLLAFKMQTHRWLDQEKHETVPQCRFNVVPAS